MIHKVPDTEELAGWEIAVARKRKECAAKIPAEWRLSPELLKTLDVDMHSASNLIALDVPRKSGILTEAELDISENYSAVELLRKLAARELSSLEVTTAFSKRAAIAQQLISCLTETCFPEALERARYLDDYLKRTGKVVGPLHGLPISIKDSFCLKGLQATVGWVSYLEKSPSSSNSALVDMLLDMGAVLYVKTNIPQTMMTGDSENNVFGRTLNPYNTSLTAGGSSGGEGALVAFRGSILGVGTDIAGSIRIPALCCGVYGFKPSTHRIPFGGQVSGAMEGLPGPIPSAGPLGHSLEDLQLFMATILNGSPADYDHTAHAVPWQNLPSRESKSLRVGVLLEEKVFPLHPPVRRALKTAISALQKAGHEIVDISEDSSRSVSLGNRLTFQYYITGPDPSGETFGASGEPPVASVAARSNPMFSGPFPVEMGQDPFHTIDGLHQVKKSYSEAWRKVWVDNKLDVIICPGAQNTAVPHDTYGWPPYTQLWNILDYPACIIPFGQANKELDKEFVNEADDYGPQPKYTLDAIEGAPCAVQIVGRRFEDENCLTAARIIDGVLAKTI